MPEPNSVTHATLHAEKQELYDVIAVKQCAREDQVRSMQCDGRQQFSSCFAMNSNVNVLLVGKGAILCLSYFENFVV